MPYRPKEQTVLSFDGQSGPSFRCPSDSQASWRRCSSSASGSRARSRHHCTRLGLPRDPGLGATCDDLPDHGDLEQPVAGRSTCRSRGRRPGRQPHICSLHHRLLRSRHGGPHTATAHRRTAVTSTMPSASGGPWLPLLQRGRAAGRHDTGADGWSRYIAPGYGTFGRLAGTSWQPASIRPRPSSGNTISTLRFVTWQMVGERADAVPRDQPLDDRTASSASATAVQDEVLDTWLRPACLAL
jgi:hypothetical protein